MRHFFFLLFSLTIILSCKKEDILQTERVYQGPLGNIQRVVSDQSLSPTDIKSLLPSQVTDFIKIQHGVRVVVIEYQSENKDGKMVKASGTLFFPDIQNKDLPIASYQHGTILMKKEAPSVNPNSLEYLLNLGFASSSPVVTCVTDYLGLGTGEGRHLYLNSREESNSVRDIIRALRKFVAEEKNVQLNEDIYLMGYSQGGHATMAAQRDMETKYPNEFKLKASAPMAGPYALSRTKQFDLMFDSVYYPNPFYFPYILVSLKASFPDYLKSYSDILISPFADSVDYFLNGETNIGNANRKYNHYINTMIREDVKAAVKSNPNHPLRVAASSLDLVDGWIPKTPTRLYHCRGDRDVYIENAIYADSVFRAKGAPVELIDVGDLNHDDCAPLALIYGKAWFDELLKE